MNVRAPYNDTYEAMTLKNNATKPTFLELSTDRLPLTPNVVRTPTIVSANAVSASDLSNVVVFRPRGTANPYFIIRY